VYGYGVTYSVAVTLADYSNSKLTRPAWPSERTLAEQGGASVRTVERAVRALRVAGFIVPQRARWKSVRWSFGWPNDAVQDPPSASGLARHP